MKQYHIEYQKGYDSCTSIHSRSDIQTKSMMQYIVFIKQFE